MAYRIEGLSPDTFRPLFGLSDEALARRGARRVTATGKPGFPCRVSLVDAEPGETLLLVNHVSNDVEHPYRSAFAVFVRETAEAAAMCVDTVPEVMQGRPLGLRGYGKDGSLVAAALALPGAADATIRELFGNSVVQRIDVHNAAHGCFVAHVARA
jgi:hypothetical protein